MSFAIDTTAVEALARTCAGAEPVIHQEMVAGMTRSALAVEAQAKARAPVVTGNLRRSITHDLAARPGLIVARVGTNVPYARFVEEGRGPVVAGPGKVLRFTIGGVVFFRKRVGPAKAKPFMRPALEASRGAIIREFAVAVPQRIIARLGL